MAFGQQSGPPAGHRQLQELLELLIEAGHSDFKDARGPLGLTQRQASGKFSRDEADELIERLRHEAEHPTEESDQAPEAEAPRRRPSPAAVPDRAAKATPRPKPAAGGAVAAARARREAEAVRQLREVPDRLLAAELQRRGWVVMEP